jgi:ketosteroid isomerase-like protein
MGQLQQIAAPVRRASWAGPSVTPRIARVRFVGRGAASGVAIHMELAHVCTMRRGRTARLVEYTDRTEALEAVGLADQLDAG